MPVVCWFSWWFCSEKSIFYQWHKIKPRPFKVFLAFWWPVVQQCSALPCDYDQFSQSQDSRQVEIIYCDFIGSKKYIESTFCIFIAPAYDDAPESQKKLKWSQLKSNLRFKSLTAMDGRCIPAKKTNIFRPWSSRSFWWNWGESGAEWRSREEIYSSHTSTPTKVIPNKSCGELSPVKVAWSQKVF